MVVMWSVHVHMYKYIDLLEHLAVVSTVWPYHGDSIVVICFMCPNAMNVVQTQSTPRVSQVRSN